MIQETFKWQKYSINDCHVFDISYAICHYYFHWEMFLWWLTMFNNMSHFFVFWRLHLRILNFIITHDDLFIPYASLKVNETQQNYTFTRRIIIWHAAWFSNMLSWQRMLYLRHAIENIFHAEHSKKALVKWSVLFSSYLSLE